MIKVLIDVRYLLEKPSGVGTYIKNLTETLINNYSHEICFCLLGNENNFKNIIVSKNIEKIISPFFPEQHPQSDIWYNSTFLKKLRLHKIDIYHATSFMVPFRKLPCKLITTIHDRVAKKMPETLPIFFRYFLNINVHFALKLSNALITVSEFTKKELETEFKKLPPTFAVHNGCQPYLPLIKTNNTLTDNYILYVGNIEPRKGILELLKAYEYFKDKNNEHSEKLVICGKTLFDYNTPKNLANISKYKDSIIFKGYVTNEELIKLYKNSSLTVIPSFYEGFGLPVLEAMISNAPILINDIPSLNETGGNIVSKVNVTNKEEFSEKILELLSKKTQTEIRINQYQNHLKNFTWEKCAKITKEIYEHI